MLTEAKVRDALRDCYDPELPCNIVDLGLVLSISVAPDLEAPGARVSGVPQRSRVHIDLILSNPSAAAEAQLTAQIGNRLAGLETVSDTTVAILSQPPWNPQRISAVGRRILGLDSNPSLIQIR